MMKFLSYCVPRVHFGIACLHCLKVCSGYVTPKIPLAFQVHSATVGSP